MKRILLAVLALTLHVCASAQGTPFEIYLTQTRSTGVGSFIRFVQPLSPAPNTDAIMMYDGATTLPQFGYIGSGLSWNGSTLSATAAAPVNADWNCNTGLCQVLNKPTIPAAQVNADWNAVSGLAQILNKPTIQAAYTFDFGYPSPRTLAVSTSYQALNTSKAAIIYPSYACTNATQVLASSACTVQVRMGTSALTCSTGTILYTQSLTVQLGVLLTQNSTNPVPIFLPIGGHFILCPVAGTFTTTTNELSAG